MPPDQGQHVHAASLVALWAAALFTLGAVGDLGWALADLTRPGTSAGKPIALFLLNLAPAVVCWSIRYLLTRATTAPPARPRH